MNAFNFGQFVGFSIKQAQQPPAQPRQSPAAPMWDEDHARQHLKIHDSTYRDNMPASLAYKRTLHLGRVTNPNNMTPFQYEMRHKYNGQFPRFQAPAANQATLPATTAAATPVQTPPGVK